jgi:membrane protease YdiL (CAAX protease family)
MNEKNPSEEIKIDWLYCPICGTKIPKLENIKYCLKCGIDLHYIKIHMQLPQTNKNMTIYRMIPSYEQQQQYPIYRSIQPKYNDEDLLDLKGKKLWSTLASLGMTFIAFVLMILIATFITLFFIIFTFNFENVLDNPYLIIVSSLTEVVLLIIPVIFVGKYLQNPSLKNRFQILGFSIKGFSNRKILKEIFIGIAFSILGIILVFSVSLLMEFIMYTIFGAEILQNIEGTTSDIDIIIRSSDYLSLILLVLTMIFIIGTSEEILFRGFLQKGLVRNFGKSWGLIITAFIFSIIHLLDLFLLPTTSIIFVISFILNFLPFFAISLLLGFLYEWRRENLIAVVITHGVYNALTVILVFFLYSFF